MNFQKKNMDVIALACYYTLKRNEMVISGDFNCSELFIDVLKAQSECITELLDKDHTAYEQKDYHLIGATVNGFKMNLDDICPTETTTKEKEVLLREINDILNVVNQNIA